MTDIKQAIAELREAVSSPIWYIEQILRGAGPSTCTLCGESFWPDDGPKLWEKEDASIEIHPTQKQCQACRAEFPDENE